MADISKTGSNLGIAAAFKDAVYNLLRVGRYGKFFNRGMYCRLDELLFQLPTFVGSRVITSEVIYIMNSTFPGDLNGLVVETKSDPDNRRYNITIKCAFNGVTDTVEINEVLPAGTGVVS